MTTLITCDNETCSFMDRPDEQGYHYEWITVHRVEWPKERPVHGWRATRKTFCSTECAIEYLGQRGRERGPVPAGAPSSTEL